MNALKEFSYLAVAANGERRKGKMEADNAQSVIAALQADGLIPLDVQPAKSGLLGRDINIGSSALKLDTDELASFARQLHLLLAAGLSIPRSLAVMGEDADDSRYGEMCSELSARTTAGMPLSKALDEYAETFPETFRAYVSAGEATGDMERAVKRLAHTLEKNHQLKLKIKAVTAYPKMVAYAVLGLVVAIMMFLVPRYASIYQGLGQKLPAPTRALISVSNQFVPVHIGFSFGGGLPRIDLIPGKHSLLTAPINWVSPVLWVIAAVVGWKVFRRRTADNIEIGTKVEKLKWRMPVFGKLIRSQVMYRWSSTMAGALASGLQMFVALDLSGRTAGSSWIRGISTGLQEAVRAGRQLSSELHAYPEVFNAQLRAMAATGEEAGEPALMFENIANTLEDELDAMVATLGAKIEVALLMVMGAVVGGLLIVLYLPILNLSNAVGKGFGQ
jgi:type IV pilus assembly protein PilC